MACCVLAMAGEARADVTLLLGDAYGRLGSFSPTGHASLYLSRVCAESPVVLRRCAPGETGVVISRYHRVAGFDWVAIPLIPYLYAVSDADAVPGQAGRAEVLTLRDRYRREHLRHLVPDTEQGPPKGDWIQLIGAAYDRRLVGFRVKSTEEQDEQLIALLNARANRAQFNFFFRNCADFSRDVINSLFPRAVANNLIADVGLTTPKQVAKSLVNYATDRPGLELSVFVVEQIPGSRPDSRNTRGVLESLVKTKKYLIPLAALQPLVPTTLAAGYLVTGRFNPDRYVTATYAPVELQRRARVSTEH